jgi:hypothetical protein
VKRISSTFGRRYYDSEIERWITPDPADFADGPNLYAYVHNHPLAYIDPDGQFAFFLVPIALSLAADYVLPAAAAFAQPYVGPLAGALLTGLAKGYTGDYSLDGIDPSSQLCACIGMGIGTILNINPKGALKASTTVATAATKTLTHMVQKEAVDVATTLASKNVSKATPWFKSFNPYSQVTQKTSQVAEKCLTKESVIEVAKKGRNRFVPDVNAKGAHTVFRKDPITAKITHYETFVPQTNFRNPNPWESLKRFDNSGKFNQSHFNKILDKHVYEPHVHDPLFLVVLGQPSFGKFLNLI